MPKFTDVVALHDDQGKLNIFSPGDDVPAWLRGKVGDHVTVGSWPAERKAPAKATASAVEAGTTKEAPKEENPEGASDGVTAEEGEQEQSTEEEGGAELSFTGDNAGAEDEEPEPVKPTTRTRAAKK